MAFGSKMLKYICYPILIVIISVDSMVDQIIPYKDGQAIFF